MCLGGGRSVYTDTHMSYVTHKPDIQGSHRLHTAPCSEPTHENGQDFPSVLLRRLHRVRAASPSGEDLSRRVESSIHVVKTRVHSRSGQLFQALCPHPSCLLTLARWEDTRWAVGLSNLQLTQPRQRTFALLLPPPSGRLIALWILQTSAHTRRVPVHRSGPLLGLRFHLRDMPFSLPSPTEEPRRKDPSGHSLPGPVLPPLPPESLPKAHKHLL